MSNRQQIEREQVRSAAAKRKRKRRKRRYTLYYIMLFLFMVIVGCVLSVTVFFNIQNIEVEGSEIYAAEEIIAAGEVQTGDNLFRISTAHIEDAIRDKLVYVDAVQVSRSFPEGLRITVTDAVPFASVSDGTGTYTVLSAGGRVLEAGQASPAEGTVEFQGITMENPGLGTFISEEKQPEYFSLVKVYQSCLDAGIEQVNRVVYNHAADVRIFCQNRIRIDIGSINELEYKFTFAQWAITERIGDHEMVVIDATTAKETGQITYRTVDNLEESASNAPPDNSDGGSQNSDESGSSEPSDSSPEESGGEETGESSDNDIDAM